MGRERLFPKGVDTDPSHFKHTVVVSSFNLDILNYEKFFYQHGVKYSLLMLFMTDLRFSWQI